MSLDLKAALKFATSTAKKAGELLIKEQKNVTIVKYKSSPQDFATTADLKAEKLIISEIEAKYPEHNILSEEIGLINNHSDYTWVIDPLDGTRGYARGSFLYNVLISLETSSQRLLGCVYIPAAKTVYSSAQGIGSFFHQKQNSVSKRKLSRSVIYCHNPNSSLQEPQFSKIWQSTLNVAKNTYRLKEISFDALALCWLAAGVSDGFYLLHDSGPQWWDLAAGIHIAQTAGATVTDRFGNKLKNQNIENGVVVTNGQIHDQLLKLLS